MKVSDIIAEIERRHAEHPCHYYRSLLEWIRYKCPRVRERYMRNYYEKHKARILRRVKKRQCAKGI